MPRQRKGRGENSQNLDSLLDTMANVVGILVVLMAVTQVTVGDAMKRIRVFESEEGRALEQEREELEVKLAALGPQSLARSLELKKLRDLAAKLRADPDAARRKRDTASTATAAASRTAAIRRLEGEIAKKRERLASLQVRLSEQKKIRSKEKLELRLPDPRPAPPGATEMVFLGRHGRVLFPDLPTLEQDFAHVAGSYSTSRSSIARLESLFERNDVGNEWLRWRVLAYQGRPWARLEWRSRQAGEVLDDLQRPGSDFRGALKRLSPRRHYIVFWVWADTFEPYLAARDIAEAAGFAVGWEVLDAHEHLQTPLGIRDSPTPTPVD